MRRFIFAAAAVLCSVAGHAADTTSYKVKNISNWAFYGSQNPAVELIASNGRGLSSRYDVRCDVQDCTGKGMYEFRQTGTILPKDSTELLFSFKHAVPGFYSCIFTDHGRTVKQVNIAYEPEKIRVNNRGKGNFFDMLSKVEMHMHRVIPAFSVKKNKELSGSEKTVYDLSFTSVGERTVRGLWAVPAGEKEVAAMISLMPAGSRSEHPLADFTAPYEMAELVLFLAEDGTGDDYFEHVLSDISFAIDFVCRQKEVDSGRLYVQGTGTAGAYAMFAGGLDSRVRISFVCAPDFSRFAERFSIESLVSRIRNDVMFGFGLQQDVFSVQENFSIYNRLPTFKEYFVFAAGAGVERYEWRVMRDTFIHRRQG